jgi:hypothetical protein
MWQAPPFPCGSRPAWLPPSAGQFRTGRSPACLQRMDDGRNHRHIRASADPDSDALGFDLDAPDIRLGLAWRCLALMANSHGRYQGVYTSGTNGGSSAIGVGNRRACRRQVNTCCGVSLCRRAISETKAPGTSVSSTIRALSSLQNQRRRPVSVITRRVSSHGSSEPAPVSSPRSPTASRRMRRRYGRQSLHHGPTDRLKVRSRASSSFDVKCTAAAKSICSKPD